MPHWFRAGLTAFSLACLLACSGRKGASDSDGGPRFLQLSATEADLTPGQSRSFNAVLMGPGHMGESMKIDWKVQEGVSGGNVQAFGTDGNTAVYVAPASIPPDGGVYHVVAYHDSDPSENATVTVRVRALWDLAYGHGEATYVVNAFVSPSKPSWNGDAPTAFSVTPDLPVGLHLEPSTGLISGLPTAVSPKTAYTITASNANGRATCTLAITVNAAASQDPRVTPLVMGLHQPEALWIDGNRLLYTENFSQEGHLSLVEPATSLLTVIGTDLPDFYAVVVGQDRKCYLAGAREYIPGEKGSFSVLDETSGHETQIAGLEIAAQDMAIDAQGAIYVLGASDLNTAKSLYLFGAPDYQTPQVIATGLSRADSLAIQGADLFYSNYHAIFRLSGTPGAYTSTLLATTEVVAITVSEKYVYYCQLTGTLHRIDRITLKDDILFRDLRDPHKVRWDAATKSLYVMEYGTQAQNYMDGALLVVKGLEP